MSVATQHPDYKRFLPKWQRCSDVVSGQDAIHGRDMIYIQAEAQIRDASTKYLPMLAKEGQLEYLARLQRSEFFNATWRTIAGMTGMAFRKEPTVKVPPGIEPYLKDITMTGVSLDSLARDLVGDVLEYGRMGLMVDHPPGNVAGITVADAEALGLRPTIQIYEAIYIINWRYARVRNAWMLVMVVLQEQAMVAQDEFEEVAEARYRVLDLDETGAYRQRVFKVDDKGNDVLLEQFYPTMNNKTLDYLPFSFIGPSGKGDCIDDPPLIDLVDKNIAHYQINSDLRHGLHFTALPTLFLAGVDENTEFYIGSSKAMVASHPEAKAEYIEFSGAGLAAVAAALKECEKQMAVLGARMMTDEHMHVETATATLLKRAGDYSILASIVIAVSEALEWALGIFAQWAGQAGEIEYQINREFTPAPMDAQTLTALVGAWQSGALSESELFMRLQIGDIIDGQKTFEEHQTEIDAAPPPAPAPAPVTVTQPTGLAA